MTAPAASYVQLPQDGAYGGKYVRTLQRTVGSNVTYSHVYAITSQAQIKGLYYFDSGAPSAVQATAHDGTSTGFLWIQNPSASVKLRLRKLVVEFANATATAISHNSAPRIGFVASTFSGTFAGATLTLTKRKTADSANACDIRTAVTGATVTLGNVIWAPVVPGSDFNTADCYFNESKEVWRPRAEDEFVILAQNECITVYQMDNGTTNDQRLVRISGIFDEVDVT